MFKKRKLNSLGFAHHFLLVFSLVITVIGCLYFVVYRQQGAGANAVITRPTTVPPSQEVVDAEFFKIVEQLKPQPAQVLSRGGSAVATGTEVSAIVEDGGKVLKYGGKGASAALVVVTVLAFPDSLDASPNEITSRGASTLAYQSPSRASPQYSHKHSLNPNYQQYYVRAYVATGSRAHPHIRKGIHGGALTKITFSSTQRSGDDGCGQNGDFGHRWRDSEAYFNSRGWAYFPDCRRDNAFQVKFSSLPPEYKNAKFGRTVSNVEYNGSHITNITYYIDNTTEPVVRAKPKPRQQTTTKPKSTTKPSPAPSESSELSRRTKARDAAFTNANQANKAANSIASKIGPANKAAADRAKLANAAYSRAIKRYKALSKTDDYDGFKQSAQHAIELLDANHSTQYNPDPSDNSADNLQRRVAQLLGEYAAAQKNTADASQAYADAIRAVNQVSTNQQSNTASEKVAASLDRAATKAMADRQKTLKSEFKFGSSAQSFHGLAVDLDHKMDRKDEEECVKEQQAENSKSVQGSNNSTSGGTIYYKNFPGTSIYRINLENVIKSEANPQPAKGTSKKCKQLSQSRNIEVHLKPQTLIATSDPIKNIQVKLFGGVRCSGGNTKSTNSSGVAVFKGCTRGPVDIELSHVGKYYQVIPVEKSQYGSGAKIYGVSSTKGQSVDIEITLFKPYPSSWQTKFASAAKRYWKTRHANGIANEQSLLDSELRIHPRAYIDDPEIQVISRKSIRNPKGDPNTLPIPKGIASKKVVAFSSVRCSPSSVALVAASGGGEAYIYSGSVGGARAPTNEGHCRIYLNVNPWETAAAHREILDQQNACILFVHEYGHLLGYPDFTSNHLAAEQNDIMWSHAVSILYNPTLRAQFLSGSGSGCN